MSIPPSQAQQKSSNSSLSSFRDHQKSWRKRWRQWFALPILISSVMITGGIWGIRQIGWLQFWELTAYDYLTRLTAQNRLDERLLIVGVEESDIQKLQQGHLSDATVAKLLENLQIHRPAVIGLDIFRDVPHPPGGEQLAEALKANNIIAPTQLPNPNDQGVPPPSGIPPSRVGFVDLLIDPDNVVRRYYLYGQSLDGQQKAYSFALQVSRYYLQSVHNQGNIEIFEHKLQLDSASFPRLTATTGGYHLPPSEALGWQVLLDYQSPEVAHQITLEQALTGNFNPDWVKDKIVLIGYTAPSKKDTFPTPYSATKTINFEMAGVVIHASMVSQLLRQVFDEDSLLWVWPQGAEFWWILGCSLVGGVIVWRINRLTPLGMTLISSAIGIWLISWVAFTQGGWIPSVPPILGLVLTGTSVLAYKAIYHSYHDPLTDLPNRRLFLQKLKKLRKTNDKNQNKPITVIFLDIDHFNTINAALGHEAGNYLLEEIAIRLQQLLKKPSFVGRVGGDEFAICLQSQMDKQQINQLVNDIHRELTRNISWQNHQVRSTASIGIAYDQQGDDFQAQELLRYADIAMNRAKELGKDRHELYVSGMDTQAAQRWQLETDLWAALDHREFQMYYQPIIALPNQTIVGFEALVRWQSPTRGFVSPGEFIPVAEETGLIIPLGHWIFSESCRQMREWQEQFPQHSSLTMSVNLSSSQFNQPDLVGQIRAILKELGVSAETLKLEITESMMMNDVEKAIELLQKLKSLGLRLSIDDFGTGYSSLSYLHRFPVDTLKVDRSFVSRMEIGEEHTKYTQIVRAVISLGHNLDLDVIAEGIETVAQIRVLQNLDCDYGQGYYFSKPLSQEDATNLLKNPPQW